MTTESSNKEHLQEGGDRLIDQYGRRVDYLRISLTQRCDHFCFFCHREGEKSVGRELTPKEIQSIVRAGTSLGIRRVKLTGGEPLMRADILRIVRIISPLVDDLSLTTNGSRLEDIALDLKRAGLDRVNVSLHSLTHETHRQITKTDDLDKVKHGIARAIEVGLSPVKINMTVLSGVNDSEIKALMTYAAEVGATLQIIELQYMPDDNEDLWNKYWADLKPIEDELADSTDEITTRELHSRNEYIIPLGDSKVKVEVVRPTKNAEFCSHCTRLRITSDGQIKSCLLRNDNLVNVQSYLSRPNPQTDLQHILQETVAGREPFWKVE